MSNMWGLIEVPEQVKFKDIISEQISRSVKEKSDFHLDVIMRNRSTAVSNEKYLENEIIPKMLEINKEEEDIEERPEYFEDEFDDDINITVKGEWEKLDFSERVLIPYEKSRPKNFTNDGLKFFKKDKATKLLLEFPKFQWYQTNKTSPTYTWKSKVREWEDGREKKILREFNDAIDPFTFDLINEMIHDGFLEEVDGILSCDGTKAVVLHSKSNPKYFGAIEPKELALKIYKKNIYILKPFPEIPNYSSKCLYSDLALKKNSRGSLTRLATRELMIMRTLRFAGIRCPEPIYHDRHIIVMSFIGEHKTPAPKLKTAALDSAQLEMAYNEIISTMKIMYQKLHLINTGFLEDSVCWFRNHCYFMDFSQVIKTTDEAACDFLWYDCKAVIDFFREKKTPDILAHDELFYFITGFDYFEYIKKTTKYIDCGK